MFSIRTQMIRLLSVSALASFEISGASWVVLMAARGFSMIEIGIAEGAFHAASLLFEIPSGVISDVFGRRKSMILSSIMRLTSMLLMIFSRGLPGVCLSLAFAAFSYNFASGAREALAYDSLKLVGQEAHYIRYSSIEMMLYRMGNALATLLAGFALWLGYKRANMLDFLIGLVCLFVTFGLHEVETEGMQSEESVGARIVQCFRSAFAFLKSEKKTVNIMLANAFAGVIAILISFFLQAQLPLAGLKSAYLGPALFVMGLGGAAGAKLATGLAKMGYKCLYALCLGGVLAGFAMGASSMPLVMIAGGFMAGLFDDMLQVRTDALLNDRFPSSQRATLLSVSSLCFSLVMIALSPLAGWFFDHL